MFNTFDFNLDLHNNNNIYHVFNNFYIFFNIQVICIVSYYFKTKCTDIKINIKLIHSIKYNVSFF